MYLLATQDKATRGGGGEGQNWVGKGKEWSGVAVGGVGPAAIKCTGSYPLFSSLPAPFFSILRS